jgi:gas vesicle protein
MGVEMATDSGAGAGNVMLAFLLGTVAGAAVALLYAPAAGRDTRDFLGERAREGRDLATEAAAKGREAISRGRETVATAVERGRDAYQQARGAAPTSGKSTGPAAPSREGA